MIGRRWPAAALALVVAAGLLGLAWGPLGLARGPLEPESELSLMGPARGEAPGEPAAYEPSAAGMARPAPEPAQPNAFFNPKLFYGGLAMARGAATSAAAPLAGGLVPHHDLAAELLSGFFMQLEAEPPDVIFLVGPNHDAAGAPVVTGRRAWQTDFGLVEADREAVDALVAAGLAAVDEAVLEREHSMGTLMPYIKYHAPGARVVPLVLHRNLTLPELQRLADGLGAQLGPGRILVASVDFSHYLTRVEAEARDEETLATIMAGDRDRLLRMGNDHLDSPGAVAVLLMAMAASGAEGPIVLGHTNSGLILRDDLIETTSYFTFVFLAGDGAKATPQMSRFVVITSTETCEAPGTPQRGELPRHITSDPRVTLRAKVEDADNVRFVARSRVANRAPHVQIGTVIPDSDGTAEVTWDIPRPGVAYVVWAVALKHPTAPLKEGDEVDPEGDWVSVSGAIHLMYSPAPNHCSSASCCVENVDMV